MTRIRVNNIELYHEVTGAGESIVFIHGLGSSTYDWENQVDVFSRTYQVVVFDVRGHGRSDKPVGPYSISLFAEDTAELIRALDIAPAHIVGISMGAMIGLQLAVDAPELVKSLVVVNSGADMIVRTLKQRFLVIQRHLIVRLLGMRKMGELLSKRLFPEAVHAALRKKFVERWAENDPRAYRDAINAIVGWDVTERLAEIGCPVLVMAADADYTPLQTKVKLAEQLQRGKLVVIENSRHATPVERPDQFNEVVLQFLQAQESCETYV